MTDYSPELIADCKETQLIRFQSKVVSLAKQPEKHNLKIIKIALLLLCVLCGLLGGFYLLFEPLVRTIILKQLVLSPDSETYALWKAPPISPHLKVYMFNLTNPEAVFLGTAKPMLKEIGPYTYRQHWEKQNITWSSNGTISYRTRKTFRFVPKESCDGCSDKLDNITTLNVPAISAYYQSQDLGWLSRIALGNMMSTWGHKPWVTRSIHELLWGYDEPLFQAAQYFTSKPPPFTKFGLFLLKNSTEEKDIGLFSMYTGEQDPYKLYKIHSFNGLEYMNHWNSSKCNRVHGSDGASFNPYVSKMDTLWFFNDQLCRAMPLVFNSSVTQAGLPGLRFVPRNDVFMSAQRFPKENSCFWKPGLENGDGVFDVTLCQFDTPIILSWPHFLGAESKYSSAVEGLHPDPEKHGFWFDVQDVTGTTLSAQGRIQINMKVHNMKMFDPMKDINDTVIPILWFNEGIDELGDDIVNVLKRAVTEPNTIKYYVLVLLSGTIVSACLVSGVGLGRVMSNRSSAAKVERLRQQIGNKLQVAGGQLQENESAVQLTQPMLEGYLESNESSRCTTATHSRNNSEGVTPSYLIINTSAVNKRTT